MRKDVLLLSAAMVAACCGSAQAAQQDHFYVGANAGQANYPMSDFGPGYVSQTKIDRHDDLAYGVLLGYRWSGPVDIGVETGFVDLGRAGLEWADFGGLTVTRSLREKDNIRVKALTLGLSSRYLFGADKRWFVSARGGLMRGFSKLERKWEFQWRDILSSRSGTSQGRASESDDRTSWYAGLGFGYRVTDGLSLALTYDVYKVKAAYRVTSFYGTEDKWNYKHTVSVPSLYAEYSF